MSDDPFADLGDTLDDDQEDSDDQERTADEIEEKTETMPTQDPIEAQHDPMTDAAFSYDEAEQRPFYALQETIDDFDSWMNYELERELAQRGYQNINIREMTDAVLRTVVEEALVDEVAERFEEAREDESD